MRINDILFSVHDYDKDGDVISSGIFLHFGETRIKVADNLDEFKKVTERISGMVDEIRDNYKP
jgi:hypothetical protein